MALAACAVVPIVATAQALDGGPSRFEVSAGAGWLGTTGLGGANAELVPGQGTPALVLFSTTSELASPAGVDGRIGVRVTPSVIVSAVASLGWGHVNVSIASDAEAGRAFQFEGERLLQARFEGRVDWLFHALRFAGGRGVPFATASIGILQQWHESYTIKEAGQSVLAGGGIRYLFRCRRDSRLSQAGVTAEIQVCHLRGGYHLGTDSRTMPAFGVGFLTGWGKRR